MTLNIDRIFIGMVPTAVDGDITMFEDDDKYWDYCMNEAKKFLKTIPEEIKKGREEEFEKENRWGIFSFEKSPYNFILGFAPRHIIRMVPAGKQGYTAQEEMGCPEFDMIFNPKDENMTKTLLEKAIKQFYLREEDIAKGSLTAIGFKGDDAVIRDEEFLDHFLKKGTKVQIRCNYGLSNGKRAYVTKGK